MLAVYNGEKFLKQQIDSLLEQTYKDIKIVVRDDGSTDNSCLIIDDYCKEYPDKICRIIGQPTGSAKQNFARLLEHCDSDYIMFCDQDDVWLPDKIEKTMLSMKAAEENGDIPVLVHTDLKIANQQLDVISNSLFDFQKLIHDNITLPKLLVQNYVTGCTVMINRALKNVCGQLPDSCIMHDWWLALTAVLFGKLVFENSATILYRQHSENQVGSKASYGIAYVKQKLSAFKRVRNTYNATYSQAQALLENYASRLSKEQKHILEEYCDIPNKNKFSRILTMQKYGFKKCTRIRVIGQYLVI